MPPQTKDFINFISLVLDDWIDQHRHLSSPLTIFTSSCVPQITIKDYLIRAATYLRFEEINFIYMLIYIERYFANSQGEYINDLNVHRLAFTCLRIAHKFIDDHQVKASLYSKTAGTTSAELNSLELHVLEQSNYNLYVSLKNFLDYKKVLALEARSFEAKLGIQFLFSFSEAEELQLQQLQKYEFYRPPEAKDIVMPARKPKQKQIATAGSTAVKSELSIPVLKQEDIVAIDAYIHDLESEPSSHLDPQAPKLRSIQSEPLIKIENNEPIKYCTNTQQWFYKKTNLNRVTPKESEALSLPWMTTQLSLT